jgi:hypothetical protein
MMRSIIFAAGLGVLAASHQFANNWRQADILNTLWRCRVNFAG